MTHYSGFLDAMATAAMFDKEIFDSRNEKKRADMAAKAAKSSKRSAREQLAVRRAEHRLDVRTQKMDSEDPSDSDLGQAVTIDPSVHATASHFVLHAIASGERLVRQRPFGRSPDLYLSERPGGVIEVEVHGNLAPSFDFDFSIPFLSFFFGPPAKEPSKLDRILATIARPGVGTHVRSSFLERRPVTTVSFWRRAGSRAEFRASLAQGEGSFIRPRIDVTPAEAANLLEGLVRVDEHQIRTHTGRQPGYGSASPFPILTGIQQGRVRYEVLDPYEEWKTWGRLVSELETRGTATGDCEDLSSAVAAELRFAGIPARTYVYKSGPKLYHVVVQTDRWGTLDPSRSAGMEGDG